MNTLIRRPGLFETAGSFTVGCNWWASHAGTAMWHDWRPEVVEADFAQMAAAGVETVRLFPLWPDFQPLTLLRGGHGQPREYRHGEQPLPDRSGTDPVMLERLAYVCATAHRHGIGTIIGLVTGWMSGRYFAPPALLHLNAITDPEALLWQVRLVRAIVGHLREAPGVAAWDLGNECNVMGPAPSPAAAAHWTATIADAIRAVDQTRPVVSGMHSLLPEAARAGNWSIEDQGEHCDVLTTHPYPHFTPHTAQDRIDDPRTTHHATAETRMYGDIGRRPACAEEIGTLGPNLGDDRAAAAFVRVNLFSLWANDCRGLLWWSAFDQGHLANAPYDWTALERELGMFRADRSPRPLLQGFTAVRALRDKLPGGLLPPPRCEAVCILTRGQDHWAVAWAAWILAKQAGFGLRFAWADEPLPEAARYILPSVIGDQSIPRRHWLDLIARVEAGADLLLTLDGCFLSPFAEVIGAEITGRRDRRGPDHARLADGTVLPVTQGIERVLSLRSGTEVLARGAGDAVLATRCRHGRGRIDCWTFPLEAQFTATRGGCDEGAPAWHRVYALWCDPLAAGRAAACDSSPWLALTEHDGDDRTRLLVVVNHGRSAVEARLRLASGWRCAEVLRGPPAADGLIRVAAQDAVVIQLRR